MHALGAPRLIRVESSTAISRLINCGIREREEESISDHLSGCLLILLSPAAMNRDELGQRRPPLRLRMPNKRTYV